MGSKRSTVLLLVGLGILLVCLFGAFAQYSIYNEHKDDLLFIPRNGPARTGGAGAFAQALTAWNNSGQSEADAALNAMIFCIAGCGAGAALMIYSQRSGAKSASGKDDAQK